MLPGRVEGGGPALRTGGGDEPTANVVPVNENLEYKGVQAAVSGL